MAWLISVLGAALAVGGGVALWNGSGYIRLDWGQAETVAGTVALSSGVVTVAVAAVLFALRDLARSPGRAAASGVGPDAPHLSDGAEVPTARGRLASLGLPKVDPAPPVAARALDDTPAGVQPPAMSPAEVDEPHRYDGRPHPVPEAPRPAMPDLAEAPTVVGRYEANGASYVLFSDGTIEVETDTGTHRFASMTALRDHIERQDAT